jgi:hypothetical protein
MGESVEPRRSPLRLTTRRRKVLAALFVAALVGGPTAVFANHRFPDVPSSNSGHDDVATITDAGIVRGCGSTGANYCPDNPVTRLQMAQFLARAGGAAAGVADSTAATLTGSDTTVLELPNVTVPGRSGGTQQVKVDAHATVRAGSSGCPCTMTFFLREVPDDPAKQSSDQVVTIDSNGGDVSVSASMVVSEPTGTDRTYQLAGRRTGTGTVTVTGDITATTYPFGA